ncbi:MAG: hypothetical protein LCH56_11240 [Proteobacteria bacterium]|nr:hypothetical protein [Pseudomonadota bacterium]
MRPTAVDSSFEVAFWFLDRAVEDGEYLQPQKLQRLMYLAQAYFGVLQHGAKLMPATFVARDEGPIEPTIFKALARGRPAIDIKLIDEVPRHVLDSVWRQFGAHSIDYLDKLIKRHPPYADALAAGAGSEISLEAMIEFYGTQGTSRRPAAAQDAPSASKVLRPKVMRNHSGKPVTTTRWMPKRVD